MKSQKPKNLCLKGHIDYLVIFIELSIMVLQTLNAEVICCKKPETDILKVSCLLWRYLTQVAIKSLINRIFLKSEFFLMIDMHEMCLPVEHSPPIPYFFWK